MHEGEDVANLDDSPVWVQCLDRHALSVLYYEGRCDCLHIQLPILLLTYLGAGDDNALISWCLHNLRLMLLLQPEHWKTTTRSFIILGNEPTCMYSNWFEKQGQQRGRYGTCNPAQHEM
jgi:hypothetical protein